MTVPNASNRRSGTAARLGLALMASAAGVGIALAMLPQIAQAQASGVDALLRQAQYWRSKGREDLAQQALRRARTLDPQNAAVKKALASPQSAAAPAARPKATPAPKPAPAKAQASRTQPAPSSARTAPTRVAASTPASTSRPSANGAGQARMAGFAALDNGNLPAAATQFERVLSSNPRDPEALGGMGVVRLRQGNFGEAANLLQQASRLGRASQWEEGLQTAQFFAGIDQARSLVAQNRLADAQDKAEALVRSGYPEPAPALEILGDIYERQGRHADAADLYRQASAGAGSDERRLQMRAIRGRALAAAERGDDIGATREFQSGLVLDPQDPWIRYEFAHFMIGRGRVPEAESLVRSLSATGQPDAIYAAALLNNELGRAAEADRLLATIPETQRTAPMRTLAISVKTDAAITRAQALAMNGRQAEAVTALRQLGMMASLSAGKQAAVANALCDLGDVSGAAQVAEQAMGNANTLADYEGLVGVLARSGRADLAQVALDRAAQLAGSSPDGQRTYARIAATLMVNQADAARLSGQFAESFDILQQAYTAAPDNVDVLSTLARLYQTGGMPDRAAQTYQLVLARKPGDKDALLGLADTAQTAGDSELSEQAQRQVLQSYGQDYKVLIAIAGVERTRGNERAALRMLKQAQELYTREQGATLATGNPFARQGANPFASAPAADGGNPFRNQVVAPPANPFALESGTRLRQSYAAAPQPGSGYSVANYDQVSNGLPMRPAAAATSSTFRAPVGMGAPVVAYAAPSAPASRAYGGDPVMAQIQSQIVELTQQSGPRIDIQTGYRARSGEAGLSQLDEIKGSVAASTGLAGGRVYVRGDAVVIDAGRPTGSGLARFGRNGTIEAQAIVNKVEAPLVNADSQQNSGVAFSAGYQSDMVQVEAGTTPVGMGKTKFAGRLSVSPKVSETTRISAIVERKPVTDSIVSYAGTRDPVTGERWGQVMRDAAGAGVSYDADGSGFYGEGRYYRFRGSNVARNNGFEANIGGYVRAYRDEHSSVTTGLNVNYQSYDKSQNYFTFGNGGYFSPQSFISVGFPVNYRYENERFEGSASLTPGFQSYKEDRSPLYPTDPGAQAQLDRLKAVNDDVRSYYDSNSKTGFALSAEGSLYYTLNPGTRIGGDLSYNSFGSYDEFRSLVGVRQSFGSSAR